MGKIHKASRALRKLNRRYIFVGLFALVGVGALIYTLAATPFVSVQTESAQGTGTTVGSDTLASGGAYLKFGSGPTTPTPPADGRPGPTNTGASGTLTTMSSSQVVSMLNNGQRVIENTYIKGQLNIPEGMTGSVTLRNFVLDGYESSCGKRDLDDVVQSVPNKMCYGIQNCMPRYGCVNLVAEDGEIKNYDSAAIVGYNYTARRLEIHEASSDGFKIMGGNILIERSWGHHLGKEIPASVGNFGSPHADFVQAQVAGSNIVIRYNYCNFEFSQTKSPYHSNACYIGDSSRAAVNIDMYGNWLFGGNYTVNCYGISTVKVHDNIFSRDYNFGVKSSCPGPWTNNKYEDGTPA